MWDSRTGVFPQGSYSKENLDPSLGGGRPRWTIDEPETPPGGSTLPTESVCQAAATRHRTDLRNQPFFIVPPGARPWELVMCEKRHWENHEGTRFFSSKEKTSKWSNALCAWPTEWLHLSSQCWNQDSPGKSRRLWSPWQTVGPDQRGIKDKAIAPPIPRPDDLVRLLIGSYSDNIPFVNYSVSVGPTSSPPLPPTNSR